MPGDSARNISDPMFRRSGPLNEGLVGFRLKPDPLVLSRGSGLDNISDPMLSEFGPKLNVGSAGAGLIQIPWSDPRE